MKTSFLSIKTFGKPTAELMIQKQKFRKTFSFFLAVVLMFSFCSCTDGEKTETGKSSNADIYVMSYEGTEISSGLYAYILSSKKTDFLYIIESTYGSGYATDSESFWNTVPSDGDNRNYGERVISDINDYCRMLLVSDKLCLNYSVSLSDEYIDEINSAIEENVFYYGSEKAFEERLKPYGLDIKALKDYYEREYKIVSLKNVLYGNGGIYQIDSDEVNRTTADNYVKLKHVYFKGEDADALKEKANGLVEKLTVGEIKFADLQKETEDGSYESYPDGYVVEREEYEESGLGIEIGEFAVSEIDGGIYIIARDSLNESDLAEYYEATETELINDSFYKLVKQYFPLIKTNNEELSRYDIVTAEVFEW